MPIRVLLADDHALVRAGIRALIDGIDGVEVIAEAGDGVETLRLIKELRPDLVLLDITMPEPGGFEVLQRTTKEFSEERVILLTVHASEEYVIHALRSGARGYLPKTAVSTELELAIKSVAQGETYVSPEMSKKALLERVKDPAFGRGSLAGLTPRHRCRSRGNPSAPRSSAPPARRSSRTPRAPRS